MLVSICSETGKQDKILFPLVSFVLRALESVFGADILGKSQSLRYLTQDERREWTGTVQPERTCNDHLQLPEHFRVTESSSMLRRALPT